MGNTITQENLITEPKKKERIIAFDFLRIIAALAVIMIHTSGIPFVNYANSLSRFAVPVFLMISGALMLNENKKITFKDIFKKILFFTLVILFWNVTHAIFFQVIERLYQHQKIYLANIVTTTILGHFHFWYMYLLLGLYLITPILRLFIKKSNIKFINYYVILAITFSFLPDIINVILNKFTPNGIDNIFIDFIDKFYISGFFDYITYYILGWLICNLNLKKRTRIIIYLVGILSVIIITYGDKFIFAKTLLIDNLQIFNLCYSLAIFTFTYYLLKNKTLNNKSKNFIIKLSSLSFGVFLIHEIIKTLCNIIILDKLNLNNNLHCIILWFITAIISFAICYIISLIPFVKKLIRG